jgi:hypothetical protein
MAKNILSNFFFIYKVLIITSIETESTTPEKNTKMENKFSFLQNHFFAQTKSTSLDKRNKDKPLKHTYLILCVSQTSSTKSLEKQAS